MRSRAKLLICVGTVLALGLLAVGTILHLDRGALNARLMVATLLEADARGIETALDRQLLQADGTLAGIPNLLAAVADADRPLTARVAHDLLSGIAVQSLLIRNIMLVRPDGTVWASSLASPGRRLEGVDPAIFVQSRGTVASGFIGPLRNRITGDWSIFLTRLVGVPGQGALTAVAEIPLPALGALMSELRLNVDARIVLDKRTGEVVASLPHDEELIGRVRPPASAQGRLDRAFAIPDRNGADETFVVVRHLLFGDIYVTLTSDAKGALAPWRAERERTLTLAGIAATLILAVAVTLLLLLRQAERMAEERARVATVLENAIDGMADGFVMWDEKDRLVTCNEVYRNLYAVSRPFLVPGTPFEDIIRQGAMAGQYPEAAGRIDQFVEDLITWHRKGAGAIERLLPDGRWLLIRERRMSNGGIVGIRTDITALKSAQAELAAATARATRAVDTVRERNRRLRERDRALHSQNALFQAALDNMSHGLLMVDGAEKLIVANPRFADLFGIDASRLVPGISARELIAVMRETGILDAAAIDDLRTQQSNLADGQAWGTFTTEVSNGRVIAITQRPLDEGGWVAIYEDVTSQRRAERRIHFLAQHDDLTKLPNRARFRAELDERLSLLGRHGRAFAVLYLDLDGFKDVNDTFGHLAGDSVLIEVASRLRAHLRDGDLAARVGGDEFAVIRADGVGEGELAAVSESIIRALSSPFDLAGTRLTIGTSIGIAVAASAIDREELLRNADLALYQAKSEGRGTWCLFDPVLERRRGNRMRLEQDLRDAIAQGAFTIDYQPIFNLRERGVSGFEALIRWHHPQRGWVSPIDFIPVAEEIGLIDVIGASVLRTACRDIAMLPGQVRIAVNLSAQQLRSGDVVATVADALAASGLLPNRLELEITETALLADNSSCAEILQALSGLGVRLALDDFGTGYSSLSHLRNFPLDRIKIDKSFVREMKSNRESAAIVTSIVELAAKLGMATTAEGVETAAQLRDVRAAGCDEAQGYLLGKPRSILHAVEVLGRSRPIERPRTRRRRSA